MKNRYSAIILFVFVFYLVSCTSQPVQQQPAQPKAEVKAPAQAPAAEPPKPEPVDEVSAEVKDLLAKSQTRVQSIFYKYKGPETGDDFYDFYIKGVKIKYNPYLPIKTLDKPESYDSIFIDSVAGTAQSYCMAAYCAYKGKKEDLIYKDVYIQTVFDWIADLTIAKKVGEEVIDSRSTWKIETNKGFLWVDSFYGIPLKAESGGKTYRFQKIAVNSVQDSDVVPS